MDTTKSRPDARQVCVIGNGGWGTALSLLLLQNGHSVTLWGHSQEELDEKKALRIDCFSEEHLKDAALCAAFDVTLHNCIDDATEQRQQDDLSMG